MNARQREEERKYLQKIDDLRKELAGVNRTLGESTTKNEALKSENAKLEKRKDTLETQIAALEVKLEKGRELASSEAARANQEKSRTARRANALKQTLLSSLGKEDARLRKSVAELRADERTRTKRVAKLKVQEKRAEKAEERARDAERRSKASSDKAREERAEIAREKRELRELIAKNGLILTQIERTRGTVEHYVKRLQRHYDKLGINIDLLQQFGIKRDNT